MSIRTRDVPASAEIELDGQVYPIVTRDDLIAAAVDLAITVELCGGCGAITVQRIPTGVPNEMRTTRALVTWQDRTNAKPQPERAEAPVEPEPVAETVLEEREVPRETAGDRGPVIDDGLVVDRNAVDESDPELRAAVGG